MKKALLALIVVLNLTISCKKGENNRPNVNENYLVFGKNYGFCMKDCATLYMLRSQKLYSDTTNTLETPLNFKGILLDNEKYKVAKPLWDEFPTYLKKNLNATFGCPDCHDQGVIYIELKENGKISTWRIDPVKERIPDEIKTYISNLEAIMKRLE